MANRKKDWAIKIAAEASKMITAAGHQLTERDEDIDIIVGGDGTIFYKKDWVNGAIFAIGGPQSKVCQVNNLNWKSALTKLLKVKKPIIEKRIALSVQINKKKIGWAINDVVVHTRRHNFVMFDVSIGKNETLKFGGDGVIISTPTGASGYAYSAGGFVIPTSDFIMEVVPICSYLRKAGPKLVPITYKIEIKHKGEADLILDGQRIIELGESDVVMISGDKIVKFIKV